MLHNAAEPAVIFPDGEEHWYLNGKLHREGGPAITHPKHKPLWFLYGEEYTFDNYCKKLSISDEDKLLLALSCDYYGS